MKILVTGMNKQQCTENYYKTSQMKIIPSHISLLACLRDMGHTVEQRIINIGENLSSYDKIICYIHNPSGFAGFVYNALWLINERKDDVILAFDDWQIDSIYKGISSLSDETKLFREFVRKSQENIPDNIEDYTDKMLSGIDVIISKKNKMLISAFSNGDLTKLLDYDKDKLYSFNPNPYHINIQADFFFGEKEKVFNFAGLMQDKTKKWLKSQDISGWNLKQYGSRKDGQDRLTEPNMVNVYAQQWGILMPPYNHAGSGWWRARPLQVADAGSIIIGGKEELMIIYKNEEASSITAKDLINMTDKQLIDFSELQKDCLYKSHPLDKSIEIEELTKVLNN
jgi:hypothetical protein